MSDFMQVVIMAVVLVLIATITSGFYYVRSLKLLEVCRYVNAYKSRNRAFIALLSIPVAYLLVLLF